MTQAEWFLVAVLALALTAGILTILVWTGYLAPIMGIPL